MNSVYQFIIKPIGKRYNNELNVFEGYNGTNWLVLNGVQDLDGNTKITAEVTCR